MEPTRRNSQHEQIAPADFGVSSDSTRRCKTCACHIAIPNPRVIGQSQSLCRRDPVQLVQTPGQNVSLTYPPTQPDLVCFDGWRPADVAPGAGWRMDVLGKSLAPAMVAALKQAGVAAKLAEDVGRAMCNAVVAAASLETPPGNE